MVKWMGAPFIATYNGYAKFLLRIGVTPNMVTITGTTGVLVGALWFFPQADHNIYRLFVGTMVITFFVFWDMTDGTMARLSGKSTRFGAFLDSTLDRFADAAIFGGIAVGLIDVHRITAMGALACLVFGSFVPYTRARAEGLGIDTKTGIATRVDRLVIGLVATGLVGLGLDIRVLTVTLWFLAIAAFVTVFQRGYDVWKASKLDPRLPVVK